MASTWVSAEMMLLAPEVLKASSRSLVADIDGLL